MASADFQSQNQSPFARFRRDQIHPAARHHDDLASFQHHVADLLHRLADPSASFLSIPWLRRLLDCFLLCQEEFRLALFTHAAAAAASPRLTSDFLDRSVKALDILNAVRDGLDQLRHSSKHLDIVLAALPRDRAPNPGRLLRAHKALSDLTDTPSPVPRNRSFPRPAAAASNFRTLSWSVSRSWSASRQLQAMASGLTPPRSQEVAATHGLANLFYTMGAVTVFAAWALVAAIPCQDRGMQASFSVPRSGGYPWAGAMMGLHDRILDEAKKRDRKQSGLLREIQGTEKCVKRLMELIERSEGPLSEGAEGELRREVEELAEVCRALKEGLDPLESQVREMFHRMVRCRMEGLGPSSSTM